MKKKIVILIVLVLTILIGIFQNIEPDNQNTVIHQHEVYQKEDKSVTGLKADGNLVTHLPVIILETDGNVIPGANEKSDKKLSCNYRIIDYDGKMNSSYDKPTQQGKMQISVRGNSSRLYDKKQYAITLVDKDGNPESQEMIGMPSHDNWVLNGSYIDHSLIRNYMMYNISGEIMDYAPRCRLCEVMLTDKNGNNIYQGIYTLIEKVKVSANRLNLEKYNPKYAHTSFLMHINMPIDHVEIPHLKPDYMETLYPSELIYPSETDITSNSMKYISERIIQIEKMLYDASLKGDWTNVNNSINLDSFVDYYLINELCQNYDAGRRSTYLYAGLDGKLSIGPVWDFDGGFDNFTHLSIHYSWLDLKSTFYYTYLIKNPEFNKKCVKRYFELRKTVFSDEYLLNYIDECESYLGTSVMRNEQLWYADKTEEKPEYFNKDIEKIKKIIVKRTAWLDSYFEDVSKVYK